MTAARITLKRFGILATVAVGALLTMAACSASAAVGPLPRLVALSTTTAKPGGEYAFRVRAQNPGDEPIPQAGLTVTATLPTGMTGVKTGYTPGFECPSISGLTEFTCSATGDISPFTSGLGGASLEFKVTVPNEDGVIKTASFDLDSSVGTAHTIDPVTVAATDPPGGIDAFDGLVAADAAGTPSTFAGSHPYEFHLNWDFNTWDNPNPLQGPMDPVEDARNIVTELPPGFVANTTAAGRCTVAELINEGEFGSIPACPPESQVGMIGIKVPGGFAFEVPIFSLVTTPGVAARFGFYLLGTTVVFDAFVRSGSDYGVTVIARNTPQSLALIGNSVSFWGTPGDEAHRLLRNCPGGVVSGGGNASEGGKNCPGGPEEAFLRNPTSCTSGLEFGLSVEFYPSPGVFSHSAFRTHVAPGYPYLPQDWGPEVGLEACDEVPFQPSMAVQPTTPAADSPSGLEVELSLPQNGLGDPLSTAESDVKGAVVTLPEGMVVNPSVAGGVDGCSPDQVGLTTALGATPIQFDGAPADCPDSSKIGTGEIESPLLDHSVPGAVYLAKPDENPFQSLLAIYLAFDDPASGIVIKLAGHVSADPATGRLTVAFDENPQLPFSNLHLSFFGGPRAALRTPPACGTYATEAELIPWSGNPPVPVTSSFQINQGCNGSFDPKLTAGTTNPLAGTYSPFSLRLSREDGTQELAGLRLTVPKGLLANLKGIPYCPDDVLAAISGELGAGQGELDSPSCPAASQVGTVTAAAGAGASPFYSTSGKAYWAGPYKGAPVSLAVVVPAVAGPFDLGNVVVRNGFEVDPESAQITAVADPFPAILHGIPLDLREVRLELTRPNYTLNPTSCEPMAFNSLITSTKGATASPSERFQVAGCSDLGFKPKLALRLKGKTRRGAHPALRAVLTMPGGGANIARAEVTLPKTELLENSHIRTICTRVQYAAKECPAASIYGYARAYSPILDYYLAGPVYLRSSDHQLPDLVASLDGQIHIDLVGRIDSVKGRLRSTFESVPDAPVSKFVLSMQGGKKGLLTNETELCRAKPKAIALFDGQNGKIHDIHPLVKADCASARKRKRAHHRGGR